MVPVSTQMSHKTNSIAKCQWRDEIMLPCVCMQEIQLVVGIHEMGLTVRDLAAEQCHEHDAPGNHGIDGNRTLQPL